MKETKDTTDHQLCRKTSRKKNQSLDLVPALELLHTIAEATEKLVRTILQADVSVRR